METSRRWLDRQGNPLDCYEKIKVLEQALAEIETLINEAEEDARIMGADDGQVQKAIREMLARKS